MKRKISIITLIRTEQIIGGKLAFMQCIESVYRQKEVETEHIVLIDSSVSEKFEQVVSTYWKRGWIKCIYAPISKDVSCAYAEAMAFATGSFVMFLSPESYLKNDNTLSQLVDTAIKQNANCVFGNAVYVDRYDVYDALLMPKIATDDVNGFLVCNLNRKNEDSLDLLRNKDKALHVDVETQVIRIDTKNRISKYKTDRPLITVITVVRNAVIEGRKDTLIQCLESVHCQTYENIEHIVIDGASTDDTCNILEEYVEKGWIKLISEKDKNVWDAMRKGLQIASGEYINYLNSDDFFTHKKSVEKAVASLIEKDKADYFYSEAYRLPMRAMRSNMGCEVSYFGTPDTVPYGKGLCHQSMYVRTDLMKQLDTFNCDYKISIDNYMMLQLVLADCTFAYLKEPLVTFRMGGISADEGVDITRNAYATYFYDSVGKQWGMSFQDCENIWLLKCHEEHSVVYNLKLFQKIKKESWKEYFINEFIKTLISKGMPSDVAAYVNLDELASKQYRAKKFYNYFQLTNRWIKNKNDGKSIEEYLLRKGYNSIAVYGAGELGSRLKEELNGTRVNIVYFIDRKVESSDIKVIKPDDEFEQVDAIVVTPTFIYDDIRTMLLAKYSGPIISLENIVYDL